MLLRSSSTISLLATSALASLLGCAAEASSPGAVAPADPSGVQPADGEGHGDPVDAPADMSWAQAEQGPGTAALRVLMTDAPIAADNVFVTFCGIYAARVDEASEPPVSDAGHVEAPSFRADAGATAAADGGVPHATEPDAGAHDPAGPGREAARRGGWQTISDECQTLDLLTLRDGITEAVGVATLPSGDYGQLRLMLVEASIVVAGLEHELVVPSGAESGLKIGHGFTLGDGAATTITVDFDAGRSVHYAPGRGFMLAPVIDVIDVQSRVAAARDPAGDPEGEAGRGGGSAGSSPGPRSADSAARDAAPRADEVAPGGATPAGEAGGARRSASAHGDG